MAPSMRYFEAAGSTSPANLLTRISPRPSPTSFLRGQMISSKACRRLAPEIFFFGLDMVAEDTRSLALCRWIHGRFHKLLRQSATRECDHHYEYHLVSWRLKRLPPLGGLPEPCRFALRCAAPWYFGVAPSIAAIKYGCPAQQ